MKKNNQQGITLIELLIGMTMSAMIFLVSSSLMASLFFSDTKSKHKEVLEQTKNDIQSELSSQIRWAEEVTVADTQLVIDGVTYKVQNERLYKEADPITPSDVIVEDVEIKNYSTVPGLASIQLKISLQHKRYSAAHDTLTLVVSQRQLKFGAE